MVMDDQTKIRHLVATLRAVRPWVGVPQEMLAQFYSKTYDSMIEPERQAYPFVLQSMFDMMEQARDLRGRVDSAIALGEESLPEVNDG